MTGELPLVLIVDDTADDVTVLEEILKDEYRIISVNSGEDALRVTHSGLQPDLILLDIIMPDIQKCGGLLEARKIADMAHTYYVPVAPHCVVSPIGAMASAHVCAAVPNFLVLEWHWIQRLELWRSFVKEGEIIEKGWITVSDRPGLGVEMNEEGARRAQIKGTPWFEPAA